MGEPIMPEYAPDSTQSVQVTMTLKEIETAWALAQQEMNRGCCDGLEHIAPVSGVMYTAYKEATGREPRTAESGAEGF